MADAAGGPRGGDGINGAVLETRLGCAGEVLEADLPRTESYGARVGNTPSSASAIQSRSAGAQEGLSRLAQAQSNRGRRGRKKDFPDAERLVKRLVAQELVLSFVPDPEQRLWHTVTRRKRQMTRLHLRMQNQLESLLEEAHIKLSDFVTDLLGVSARRMLQALADGETDPAALAALADKRLRATP